MMYIIFGITSSYKNEDLTIFWLYVGCIIISAILSIKVYFKRTKDISVKERIFIRFFKTYNILNVYQYRETIQDTKKYQNAIRNLALFINRWTRNTSPLAIAGLSDSIYKNLINRIIPIYKNNKSDDIQRFLELLEKMVLVTYKDEPTRQALTYFNKKISEYKEEITKEKEERPPSPKQILLKYVWISPLAGIIIFFVFNQIDSSRLYDSLGYAITVSVVLLVAVVTISLKK